MVGDSLHHDIHGAQTAGIDSILVASYAGVHAEELDLSDPTQLPDMDKLHTLFEKKGIEPTHVIPAFRI